MPRRCTICDHPDREAINQALLTEAPYRSIAQQFAASPDAVYRHKQDHLPQHLCQAKAAQEVTQADVLLAKVEALAADATRIQAAAEANGDLRTALQGIRELVRIIELQARLLGELKDSATVNVLVLPQWQDLRTTIRMVLRPYPEARAAVATALLQGSGDAHTNGSRVVSLPGTAATIRGYSGVRLLVIDEAARVQDDLYHAVRPMLAVSQGRLIALSTPWGKRGWFFKEYTEGHGWARVKVTAQDCPRISPAFLEEEHRSLPALWFNSEYLCEFSDTEDSVFAYEHVMGAVTPEVQPLFPGAPL